MIGQSSFIHTGITFDHDFQLIGKLIIDTLFKNIIYAASIKRGNFAKSVRESVQEA